MVYQFKAWSEDETRFDMETGAPGIMACAAAIQLWSLFQNRPIVTVSEAARAFNINTSRAKEAIEAHPYMYIENMNGMEVIQHEGD